MKNWSLYVAGVGSLDAAEEMLTRFVSKLRDQGLTITSVQVIDGQYHAELAPDSEPGWTMTAYGEGDVAGAYGEFPTFLKEFEDAGIRLLQHGIVEGSLREIPVGTTA